MKTALDYFMQSLGITEKSTFEITDVDGNRKIVDVSEVYKEAKLMENNQIQEAYKKGNEDAWRTFY
jgi:hypothetical protein